MKRHLMLTIRVRETGRAVFQQRLRYDEKTARGKISMKNPMFKCEVFEQAEALLHQAFRVDATLAPRGKRPKFKEYRVCPACLKPKKKKTKGAK